MARRFCFHIVERGRTEGGYIPAMVTEDTPGFSLMTGDTTRSQTWVWGPTRADAERIATEANRRLDLNEDDVVDILVSSIRPEVWS